MFPSFASYFPSNRQNLSFINQFRTSNYLRTVPSTTFSIQVCIPITWTRVVYLKNVSVIQHSECSFSTLLLSAATHFRMKNSYRSCRFHFTKELQVHYTISCLSSTLSVSIQNGTSSAMRSSYKSQ